MKTYGVLACAAFGVLALIAACSEPATDRYELLIVNDNLRDRIARNPNVTEFRRECIEAGMVTLRQDGFDKVRQGMTTIDEILRVTEATI